MSDARRPAHRPPIDGTTRNRRLWIRVTEDQLEALKRVARDNQVKVADVIRDATNEYVADYDDRRIFATKKATAVLSARN